MKNYVHNFQIYRRDPLTTCTTMIMEMMMMMQAVGDMSGLVSNTVCQNVVAME